MHENVVANSDCAHPDGVHLYDATDGEGGELVVMRCTEYQSSLTNTRVRKGLRDLPDEFDDALRVLTRHFVRLNHSQRAALLPLIQARILGGHD